MEKPSVGQFQDSDSEASTGKMTRYEDDGRILPMLEE
jgi:hypothetical protein